MTSTTMWDMIIWIMVLCQLAAWGWFSVRGGTLKDKSFLVFTIGMMMGQFGAGIDTYAKGAWAAFVVQVYFFIFTAVGGIRRFSKTKNSE